VHCKSPFYVHQQSDRGAEIDSQTSRAHSNASAEQKE